MRRPPRKRAAGGGQQAPDAAPGAEDEEEQGEQPAGGTVPLPFGRIAAAMAADKDATLERQLRRIYRWLDLHSHLEREEILLKMHNNHEGLAYLEELCQVLGSGVMDTVSSLKRRNKCTAQALASCVHTNAMAQKQKDAEPRGSCDYCGEECTQQCTHAGCTRWAHHFCMLNASAQVCLRSHSPFMTPPMHGTQIQACPPLLRP